MKKSTKKIITTVVLIVVSTVVLILGIMRTDAYAGTVNMELVINGVRENYSAAGITLVVNGETVSPALLPMPPIILDGRTYVPAREIFEPLGAVVDWKELTREVYIAYDTNLVIMKPNSMSALVNDGTVHMEHPAKIINDKLMLPVRFVAESLYIPIGWDGENRIVSVGNGDNPDTEPVVAPQLNTVTDLEFTRGFDTDQLIISTHFTAEVRTYTLYSPDRLVFDIDSAINGLTDYSIGVEGNFSHTIRAAQFDATTVRVVIDLKERAGFSLQGAGTNTIITLRAPDVRNISYDQASSELKLTGLSSVNPGTILHTDNYMKRACTLTLPGDYSAHFGIGTFEINDSIIGSVAIQNNEYGNTEVIINTARVFTCNVSSRGDDIVIKLVPPPDVYRNIVFLDPGHGGTAPGAVRNGITEAFLNLDTVLRLMRLLENEPGIKVYVSRTEDVNVENPLRAAIANQTADLFVSVHYNAMNNNTSNGTEVLYLNNSQAEFQLTSEAAAMIFQSNLVDALGLRDRGVKKRDDLIVLNQTTIPAVLIEVGFMTHPDDMAVISTEHGRQAAAESIFKSIIEIFTLYPTGR
jgi:N-acetylmuramoyl-L-alanine amidase